MTSRSITYWLYSRGEPLTSVRAPEGTPASEIISRALAWFDRHGGIGIGDSMLEPFERRHLILHAEVVS